MPPSTPAITATPALATTLAERVRSYLLPLLGTSPRLQESAPRLRRFAALVVERAALQPEAWKPLAVEAGLSPEQITELYLTLDLGDLANRHLALVQSLQAARRDGRLEQLSALAQWDEAEWQALLQRLSAGAPDAQAAVGALRSRLRQRFPMVFLRLAVARQPLIDWHAISSLLAADSTLDPLAWKPGAASLRHLGPEQQPAMQDAVIALRRELLAYPAFDWRAALRVGAGRTAINPLRQGVARFFAQAPAFDLRQQRVAAFVEQHPGALRDIAHAAPVVAQLQRMQRVYRFAPDPDAMHALLSEGLHSASAVVRIPADMFVTRYGNALGGADSAARMYASAREVAVAASSLAWTARLRSAGPLPAAVGAWPPPELQVADAGLRQLLQPGANALPQTSVIPPGEQP